MQPISYKRHRYPAEVIRYAVWLYFRFTLSLRDVEELLAQRGILVSYETVRCWTLKFGPQIAANLRRRRPSPTGRWHLDEMVVKIAGRRMWLWRAVDDEGEVLDMLVQTRRNKTAAARLLRRLLKKDRGEAGGDRHRQARLLPSGGPGPRAKYSPPPRRHASQQPGGEQPPPDPTTRAQQQKFKSQGSAQRFLFTHAAVYNTFNTQPHLTSRPALRTLRAAAHPVWAEAAQAA